MKKYYISLFILALLIGCKTPEHYWQVPGTDRVIEVDTSQWETLALSQYCHIDREYWEDTVEELKEKSFIPASQEQVEKWCDKFQAPQEKLLKPYLVRGIIYGGFIDYTIVKYDINTGRLLVFHATWNGENALFSYMLRHPVPYPLIVYLSNPPKEVYPTAQLGGDLIFRGRDFDTLDMREIK